MEATYQSYLLQDFQKYWNHGKGAQVALRAPPEVAFCHGRLGHP